MLSEKKCSMPSPYEDAIEDIGCRCVEITKAWMVTPGAILHQAIGMRLRGLREALTQYDMLYPAEGEAVIAHTDATIVAALKAISTTYAMTENRAYAHTDADDLLLECLRNHGLGAVADAYEKKKREGWWYA